jgi:hypothetical protein
MRLGGLKMAQTRSEEYLRFFPHDETSTSARRAALGEARENRKFEIELYWKRAGYFWVFSSAAFVGYSTLQGHHVITFLIACSGFLFSLAWYFVNRGSKYWQENWELHVDLLEDAIAGPIYKAVVQKSQSSFWALTRAYPFSVTKINQLLSLFITAGWFILICRTFAIVWDIRFAMSPRLVVSAMLLLTVGAAIVLACIGRTSNDQTEKFYVRRRSYN